MRNISLFALALALVLPASSGFALPVTHGVGDWLSLGGERGAEPEVTLIGSSPSGMVLRVDIPGLWLIEMPGQQGRSFRRPELPGWLWEVVDPGLPEMPLMPLLFGFPQGCEPVIVSVTPLEEAVIGGVDAYPCQPMTTDDAYVFPGGFTPPDEEVYGSDELFPSSLARIDNQGVWSGLPVARLALSPVRVDAANGELHVVRSVLVEICFDGQPAGFPATHPAIARMHRASVVNYDDLAVPCSDGTDADGPVYILITNSDNLDEITPLARTQHLLGNHVVVEVLSNPATATQVNFAVTSNYQSGTTRFALIAGPHAELPSWNYGSFYGDYYYATVDGDNYPDVAVGRFSDTDNDLPNQVEKVLSYMSHTGTGGSPSIPASTALAAHEEGYPGGYTGNKEAIKNWSYDLTDIVFTTFYPPQGATAGQLEACINDGIGTVNYRGHGQNTYWQWSPGWNAGNIYNLTNTFYPVVFNVACLNGNHTLSYNCLCESWMAAEGVGASGNLGASASSYTTPNNTLDRNLYWAVYDDGITCAGEAVDAAKVVMINTYPSYGLTNARMYHWFGDPAQDIFTCDENGSPFALSLSGPTAIGPGSQNLTYTVNVGGSPESGVLVTASDGVGDHPDDPEGFYAQGTTNSSGQISLSVTAVTGDTIRVGAYKHDYAFDILDVSVGTSGIEEGEGTGPGIQMSAPAPNPSGGPFAVVVSLSSPGSVELTAWDTSGRMVDSVSLGSLSAGDHRCDWDLSCLPAGIYLVSARSETASAGARKLLITRR